MSDDDQTICPNCGTPNQPGTQFCRNCGEPLTEATPELVGATADAAGAVRDEITQITNPLMSLGPSAPVAAILVASLQRVLDTAGPREEELLRRCAVPRWFDIGVLSQL